ncbi:MAG: SCO family protein [Legionella sp.]|nr:SCO family protein [Legionella sp.]
MVNKKKVLVILAALSLMFAGFIADIFYSKHQEAKKRAAKAEFHGTLLDIPRPVKAFALTRTDGVPFTQASLKDQWTMIFFGFTHCGLVCPTTMAELGKMYRMLEEKRVSPLPHVVMVSIDPKRDDLDGLRNYVKAFNPNFYGARGSEKMTKAMAKALGIAYAKVAANPHAPSPGNDIEHTGAIMLFNPMGKLAAFFTGPHQAQALGDDYHWLINHPHITSESAFTQ